MKPDESRLTYRPAVFKVCQGVNARFILSESGASRGFFVGDEMSKKSKTTVQCPVIVTREDGSEHEEIRIEPIGNCATCEHFWSLILSCDPDPSLEEIMHEDAECRRNAPSVGQDGKGVWPVVRGCEGCGKYHPRKHSFGKAVFL